MKKPINTLIADFLEDSDIFNDTKKKYKNSLDFFVTFLVKNRIDVHQTKRKHILFFKAYLLENNYSMNTIRLHLSVIRQFYKYLNTNGFYENISEGIHISGTHKGYKKSYLNIDQIQSLLNCIQRDTISNFRDYAILNLMVRTGIRRTEVVRLNIGDIETQNNVVLLHIKRKGRLEKETIGVTSKIIEPIYEYLSMKDSANADEPMFSNHSYIKRNERISPNYISKMIRKLLNQIDLTGKEYSCHSLRHSAAIISLKNGASIFEVQQMLGHSLTSTTQIYLRAIEEETRRLNPSIAILDKLF